MSDKKQTILMEFEDIPNCEAKTIAISVENLGKITFTNYLDEELKQYGISFRAAVLQSLRDAFQELDLERRILDEIEKQVTESLKQSFQ